MCACGDVKASAPIDSRPRGWRPGYPTPDTLVPFVFVQALNADPRIITKIFAITASLFEIAMDPLDTRL